MYAPSVFPSAVPSAPGTVVEAWGKPVYKKKWLLGKWQYDGMEDVKYVPRAAPVVAAPVPVPQPVPQPAPVVVQQPVVQQVAHVEAQEYVSVGAPQFGGAAPAYGAPAPQFGAAPAFPQQAGSVIF
eukprot:CAMPEP_0114652452 /NCGR_PEP_ID=MMETSP0191-20121206/9034_1 /TAXON_ID=126664 /ORGANISM="Sorites sp." /LENGTH=125 /DNA_ID=CAMNT_0001867033 /DNA_START=1 /DNA_END=378 /DNA_ORIENTATION=-